MDYEKKYKEALESLKGLLEGISEGNYPITKDDIIEIFPELKESEDEKIRKVLIELVKCNEKSGYKLLNNVPTSSMVAWLEKQGDYHKGFRDGYNSGIHEEKPLKWTKHDELVRKEAVSCLKHWKNCIPTTWNEDYKNILMWLENELSVHTEKQSDKSQGKTALEAIKEERVDNVNKVAPKFKVKYAGNEYNVFETKDIAGVTYYGIEDEPNHIDYVLPDNCEIVSGQKLADKVEPKFNIGDVICDKLCTTLNKEAQPNMEIVDILNGMYICDKGSFPVSQQDEYVLVGKKIDTKLNDDSVSNELREASTKHAEKELKNQTFHDNLEFELIYTFEEGAKWDAAQKHTEWSEEDNVMIRCITLDLELLKNRDDGKAGKAAYQSEIEWLKSLKDRVQPQPKQEWSEWDRSKIQRICKYLEEAKKYYADATEVNECIDWLRSFLKKEYIPQSKQEWGKEDEKKRNLLMDILNVNHPNGRFKVNPANTLNMEAMSTEELVSWLKSLKDRYAWKPSDEQIKILEHFVRGIGENGYASPYDNNTKLLYLLLSDLKKLREE